MRRLLLTLLIICLALPAVAVEACAPPMQPAADAAMAMHEHHAPPAPAEEDRGPDAAMQHGCIGCVPPLAVPAMPETAPFLAGPFASEPLALALAPPVGPTPPPPRPAA